jgi:hypothetical protein
MPWIKLVHWNAVEAAQPARLIEAGGYKVDFDPLVGLGFLKAWREAPPAAMVVDLSRLPSQGRDMALAVRHSKATRAIPLVFVGGDPLKVERIRGLLPDAVYTQWGTISAALQQAIENPPAQPVRPKSLFDAYAGQALPRKLGIRAGMTVLLVKAPDGFTATLGKLPENTTLAEGEQQQGELIIWFVRTGQELHNDFKAISQRPDFRLVWIAWPKKASAMKSDVSEKLVRETGLQLNLVDFKICSIDDTWSGLCFTRRR